MGYQLDPASIRIVDTLTSLISVLLPSLLPRGRAVGADASGAPSHLQQSMHIRDRSFFVETWATSFTPLCLSFGRATKTIGPFCLVSMPGEVEDPTGEWKKQLCTHRSNGLDVQKPTRALH